MTRVLLVGLSFLLLVSELRAKVSVQLEGQPIAITTSRYSARIEPDGCLTNLKLGGVEFFAAGVGFSRGSYFYLGKPLKLPNVERIGNTVIEATGDLATIR